MAFALLRIGQRAIVVSLASMSEPADGLTRQARVTLGSNVIVTSDSNDGSGASKADQV